MTIIRPLIFEKFSEIAAGISTKIGNNKSKFGFNLSFSVGDDTKLVEENREKFANYFGYDFAKVAYQHQIHSSKIKIVDIPGYQGEYDGMITNKRKLPIVISIADCTPILLFDPNKKVIAAVHSGWKGTQLSIVKNAIDIMIKQYNSNINDIYAYVGPSIGEDVYEVGHEFSQYFDKKYLKPMMNGKFLLNVKSKILDDMLDSGMDISKIQISNLCTYKNNYLHSYRRDKDLSGRMYALIALN